MSKSGFDPCIGVTLGDPCGIGPEIAAAALQDPEILRLAKYRVIGPARMLSSYSWPSGSCQLIPITEHAAVDYPAGAALTGGLAALLSLHAAVEEIKSGRIDALVTAPLSKEAVHIHDPAFQGHTEFLAGQFGVKDVGMVFVGERIKTIIVTRHLALKDVPSAVTKESILTALRLSDRALKDLFGLDHPAIGVCGLNPHAGENGLMGTEEIETIIPALEEARKNGIDVRGPFAADTIFASDVSRSFDLIAAMYHDQGLIPVKTLSMKKLVNLTVGLPFVRTSPAHGTAFYIAGKNKADCTSMKEAIRLAVQLSQRNRRFKN